MNETDQEQIESLKQFWAKWGNTVIAVVVVLAALIIGSNVWSDSVRKNKESVSDEYQLMVQLLSENAQLDEQQVVALNEIANNMKHKFPDSVYTANAAFNVAKQAINDAQLDQAIEQFDYVIDHVTDAQSIEIAVERKAKVLLARGELDAALSTIKSVEPKALKFAYLGTTGDILVAQNKIDEAKTVYQEAIALGEEKGLSVEFLTLKLNDLSVAQ